jgi:hypothetical protein
LKLKRPHFEESKLVNISRDPGDKTIAGASITGGMRVAVHYHGREVRLLVKEPLGKGDYRGQITSIAIADAPCEDLAVGEEVIFRAASIFWIIV